MTDDPVHDAAVHEKTLTEVTEHWYRTFDSLKERAIEEAREGHTQKIVEAVEANPATVANMLASTPFVTILAELWAKDNIERYV